MESVIKMTSDLCFLTATELAEQIRTKQCSAKEVVQAHLAQIEKTNPQVNAIVTLVAEQALNAATQADEALAKGEPLGPLHGLPVVHKDLALTEQIRTTFGSRIYQDFVPKHDSLIVERLKKAGAITVGKTNTPEFGAGSQTFNEVFGATLNPYDPSKTCGGSSGGSAVALACRMVPLADGSDFGGSLRNPANFCNVVGFRASPGRVPIWPTKNPWATLPIHGPMARTVQDIALMMKALAGPDRRDPIAISESGEIFGAPLERNFQGTRIAWSLDLGGLPVDERVCKALQAKRPVFEGLGCQIEEAHPDFQGVDEIFQIERACLFETVYAEDYKKHRDLMKDTVIFEIETGLKLTASEVNRAATKKMELHQRMCAFMEQYEFLVLPVNQVPPFDVTQEYVHEINGVPFHKYTEWMSTCWYISVTGHPALSVPCGFTPEGLPVGIQIVGRYRDEVGLLQMAYAFEQATQCWKQRPQVV